MSDLFYKQALKDIIVTVVFVYGGKFNHTLSLKLAHQNLKIFTWSTSEEHVLTMNFNILFVNISYLRIARKIYACV